MEGELGIGGGGICDWWRGYLGLVEGVFGNGGGGIWNLPRIWSFCHKIWLKYHCYFRL